MPELQTTIQTRLTFAKTKEGYEIITMSAGIGNGWTIESAVLRESLMRWNNVNSFVDRAMNGRSIRDLCGVITFPRWDEERQAIVAKFTPLGPAADVVKAVAEDALSHPDLTTGLGFIADMFFESKEKKVTKFAKVNSVDLVIDPARGGKFIRALNQIQRSNTMPELPDDLNKSAEDLAKFQQAAQNVQTNIQAQSALDSLAATQAAADKLRLQMCQSLLATTLAASKLPAGWQTRIQADIKDKMFDPADLEKRISDDRALLSMTVARQSINGPAISSMFYGQPAYPVIENFRSRSRSAIILIGACCMFGQMNCQSSIPNS